MRQHTPAHIPELKNVTQLAAGSQHVLALTVTVIKSKARGANASGSQPKGKSPGRPPKNKKATTTRANTTASPAKDKTKHAIYAWGANKRGQLGCKITRRQQDNLKSLLPHLCAFPRTTKYDDEAIIGAGSFHSFAAKLNDSVYAWGYNSFGQTGLYEGQGVQVLKDNSVIEFPKQVDNLQKNRPSQITGGDHHSIAITEDGRCLSWGSIYHNVLGVPLSTLRAHDVLDDGAQTNPRPLMPKEPFLVQGIGVQNAMAAAGPGHSIAVAERLPAVDGTPGVHGKAYAWGSNRECEVTNDNLPFGAEAPYRVCRGPDGIRNRHVISASAGREFSVLLVE